MALGGGDLLLIEALGRIGPRMLSEIIWSVLRKHPRPVAVDAARMVAMVRPAPKIEGIEHVPARDPFLLVANHYQSERLWVGWVAAAITAAVASVREAGVRELHWMIAAEWRTTLFGHSVANPLTSILFPRAARVWGLVALPTDSAGVRGRALALRQAFGYLGRRGSSRATEGEPVAILPEGTATVELQEAKAGSGAFIHRASSMGVPLLPVGAHEDKGKLIVRFGKPFSLPPTPPNGEDLDDWARREVMSEVARLLPSRLWGVYAETIKKRVESSEGKRG